MYLINYPFIFKLIYLNIIFYYLIYLIKNNAKSIPFRTTKHR